MRKGVSVISYVVKRMLHIITEPVVKRLLHIITETWLFQIRGRDAGPST